MASRKVCERGKEKGENKREELDIKRGLREKRGRKRREEWERFANRSLHSFIAKEL